MSEQVNEIVERARRVREVAAAHADDVDKNARFPKECLDAQRKERLLSALVPKDLGGLGLGMREVTSVIETIAGGCGSSGLLTAMHHIQVACIVRHGGTTVPALRTYLSELSEKQRLIASVTSEVGIGGDTRSSITHVQRNGDKFTLDKDATTISYGAYADDLLITSRRDKDSPPSDQALTLVRGTGYNEYTLENKGVWDTLGMRGTCSEPAMVRSHGPVDHILPVPYGEISSRTMTPYSHILWASAWLGIAGDAVARARAYVRGEARKKPGSTPASAIRLAEVVNLLQTMRNNVLDAANECERLSSTNGGKGVGDELSSLGFAIKINNLKIASSTLVAQIVQQCLLIVGISGYKNNNKLSVARHLRDSLSAQLMIGNDRLYAMNASLLLVHKDD